ncbi:unnamed protein product [Chrysodeixis includens]|uniref:Uncharacterized protein n=1 Tax=Chrysodeixis includens TaxID=689277 RepID=A0A9N8KRY9_CHRIL|nr:unnamed protein product [Chrysodeixis includens]
MYILKISMDLRDETDDEDRMESGSLTSNNISTSHRVVLTVPAATAAAARGARARNTESVEWSQLPLRPARHPADSIKSLIFLFIQLLRYWYGYVPRTRYFTTCTVSRSVLLC